MLFMYVLLFEVHLGQFYVFEPRGRGSSSSEVVGYSRRLTEALRLKSMKHDRFIRYMLWPPGEEVEI